MFGQINHSLSFKMIYTVSFGLKGGTRASWAPSKSATGIFVTEFELFTMYQITRTFATG